MKLYFLRHGEAEPGGSISDHERQLTAKGEERVAAAAEVLVALGINPLTIFSSPRVRALQTAEIVANALEQPVHVREEVNFGFDLDAIETLLNHVPAGSDVMFVGHEPTFSLAIGELTGADVVMKTGGLARVDLELGYALRGTLVWLIAPKVFNAINSL